MSFQNKTSFNTKSIPKTAQVRVNCKVVSAEIDYKKCSRGSIVEIPVNGTKNINISTWGGDVGVFGSGITGTVMAGHKYDLNVHHTWRGWMVYLEEVDSFH